MKIELNALVQRKQVIEQPKPVSEIEKIAIGALKPENFFEVPVVELKAEDNRIVHRGVCIVFAIGLILACGLLVRISEGR